MDLLILGGTVFLGKHIVETALARGHRVTLFNRGQHGAGLFPGVEKLRGDRGGGLEALRGRRWDCVIDTSGYVPRIVRNSARLLAEQADHYTFVSTISVYAAFTADGQDESAPLGTLEDPAAEQVTGATYGPLKVLCEQAVQEEVAGRALVVRPGLIAGPDDPTDRFTYWPLRARRGGEILAPGRPEAPVQFIDVRDLAEWTVAMVERRATGVYNTVGPREPMPMGDFLQACCEVPRPESGARLTWVSEEFLQAHQVRGWSDLPLWIPRSDGLAGLTTVSNERAVGAGLTFRPPAETVRATLEWAAVARPEGWQWRAGLTPEREAEVLAAWRQAWV